MESHNQIPSSKRRGIRTLVTIFAVFGALAIVGTLAILITALVFTGREKVPDKVILTIDFERRYVEYVPDDPVAKAIVEPSPTVLDIVEGLEQAAQDDRVVGLIATIGAPGSGFAATQEFRDAVTAFRESGKPAVAFSETFGEFGPGNTAYYLATAFDKIYLQPSGDVGLTGFVYESPFLTGTLDKLGIEPRGDRRYEYKSAYNIFVEKKYTRYHREANKKVMDSQFGQLVQGIAEGRGLSEEEVRALIDRGPFLGREALDAGLVDSLVYRDGVFDRIKEIAGEGAEYFDFTDYISGTDPLYGKGPKVALIYGVGSIVRGSSGYDPVFSGLSMGSKTVAGAFRDAIEDDDIKAILFRVDSPGGSANASDTIWREVVRARESDKPVIVSMGNVAGSGGYYVAMGADKIVAQPGTITGSIGVLGLKMLMNKFYDKIGISWDEVHTSTNATIWSSTHDYTPAQWKRFQAGLDRVYQDFTGKVANGRDLPLDDVLKIARGRIWSGEDARDLGLVDELGGFTTALRLVRETIGVEEDKPVHLVLLPHPKSFLETLLDFSGIRTGSTPAGAMLARTAEALAPYRDVLTKFGLAPQPGVLTIPDNPAVR